MYIHNLYQTSWHDPLQLNKRPQHTTNHHLHVLSLDGLNETGQRSLIGLSREKNVGNPASLESPSVFLSSSSPDERGVMCRTYI